MVCRCAFTEATTRDAVSEPTISGSELNSSDQLLFITDSRRLPLLGHAIKLWKITKIWEILQASGTSRATCHAAQVIAWSGPRGLRSHPGCCVSTSESTVRLPTCPPCSCCLVSSSVNLGICAHIRPWLFIGTAMCQTSWAEAGSNQYAYVQMYLITTNDKTALASRQCLPTFRGAPRT